MGFGSYEKEKEGSTISGPLQKQGRVMKGKWLTRHYIIKEAKMFYYDEESDTVPKKIVKLKRANAIPFTRKDGGGKHGFMVQTADRSHCLFCRNQEEAQQWIDAVNQVSRNPSIPQTPAVPASGGSGPTPLHQDKRSYSKAANKVEDFYDLKEELGTGGFSVVRRGIHKESGEAWALKLIRNSVYQKNKERTEEEVSLLAQLSHPGVVQLKEVVHTPRYYTIVMELLSGGELFDRIVQREKYSENDAKMVSAEILETLAYLHDNKVVHRDLKPENLIFDKPGEDATLKLTDFGFATLYDEDQPLTATCGTPEYVAPEILEEKPYGPSVDMWSAGVIIYILLCGFPPFYGDSEQELFEKICRAEFKFLSPYWNKISFEAKDLINNLLCLDVKKRLTAKQALQHKWLKDIQTSGADESVDLKSAVDELKRYNATRKFRKAILAVLATTKMKVWADLEEL